MRSCCSNALTRTALRVGYAMSACCVGGPRSRRGSGRSRRSLPVLVAARRTQDLFDHPLAEPRREREDEEEREPLTFVHLRGNVDPGDHIAGEREVDEQAEDAADERPERCHPLDIAAPDLVTHVKL